MTLSPILDAIRNRRSIREFTSEPVSQEELVEIITAGTWAPSGLNNQPWRFITILGRETIDQIAECTKYSQMVQSAPALIAVYIDTRAMYHEVKDHQSMGACLQNMLLAIEGLNLGGVWLGEILKQKERVNKILDLSDDFDLMAVLVIGHPSHRNQSSNRKKLSEVLLKQL